jgi:hypothetical protein
MLFPPRIRILPPSTAPLVPLLVPSEYALLALAAVVRFRGALTRRPPVIRERGENR